MPKFEYKVTKKNELINCWAIIVYLIIFSIIPIIFNYKNQEVSIGTFYVFSSVAFLIFFVPHTILHLKYYSLNESKIMIYEPNELRITLRDTKKQTESVFILEDIKYIFHTMTVPMNSKSIHWMPWDSYNYSKIYLNNGEVHIITSLMVYKLELPVGEKYEVITSIYPYPK